MLLKKQTVWLLTMLSLVVVLSIYYITLEDIQKNELAQTTEEGEGTTNSTNENGNDATSNGDSTINVTDSEAVFEQMRIELAEERSRLEEELVEVQGSPDKSAQEKSEATEEINHLRELADNERMIETLIKADNYDDVLVRTAEDGTVNVTIKAEELSPEAANDIVQLVRKNMNQPTINVAVKIDPK